MTKTERNGEIGSRAAQESKEKVEDENSDGMAARISGKCRPACAIFEFNFFAYKLNFVTGC